MVGIYRTSEALEAAWKYFILGSVGIALALFGTILVYMAARPVVGEGVDAMTWTILIANASQFDPGAPEPGFHLLAARIWYQGWAGAAARVAAGCPCGGADADLGCALRSSPQCRALRTPALQDDFGSDASSHRTRTSSNQPWPDVPRFCSVHAVPTSGYQKDVCIFVHRAHGHHRLRVRDGRPARQLRRAAAHDHAQPHQVGDLLRCRSYHAGEGHPKELPKSVA